MMDTDDDDYFLDPGYAYEDLTFLEACMDSDLDAVAAILDDNATEEEINERDRCGRTGLSHLCSSGLTPALELLLDVPELDVNLPDKEGNTPLIIASQAGQTDVVRILLQHFKGIRIDQPNRLGMTALMKSAIQGRTDCSRLLLYAGADPKLRDHGRKLCAEEWASYCGRRDCADVIAKFSNTKSFYLKSREAERSAFKAMERSNSLPDLAKDEIPNGTTKPQHKRASLRKKIKKILPGNTNDNNSSSSGNNASTPNNKLSVSANSRSPFAVIARCVSTPVIPGAINSETSGSCGDSLKRPVSASNIPRVEVTLPPRDEGYIEITGGKSLRSRRRHCNSSDTIVTIVHSSSNTTPAAATTSSSPSSNTTNSNNTSSSSPSPLTKEYVTVT